MPAETGELVAPSPRLRRIALRSARDVLREHRRLYAEARSGVLPLADACKLSFLLSNIARLYETTELEDRVTALEAIADETPNP